MSSGPSPESPRARFGAPQGHPEPSQERPRAPKGHIKFTKLACSKRWKYVYLALRNLKKNSRTIFRCSECSPGTLRSGDPHPQGRPRAPQTRPGSAQAAPRTSPGPPRAPLDHPCEFHSCNILFENLRFSDFTRFSNGFLTFFKYTNRFAKCLISVFTHISNRF